MGLLVLLLAAPVPDVPPPADKPAVAPAAPLAPADAARRDALTRYGVGRLRARDERPAAAARELEAAAKSDPESPEPPRLLVPLYTELGRDAAAIRAARTVLDRDPADADTAQALGKLLFDGRKFAESAAAFQLAADSPRLADDAARRFGVLRDLARAAEAAADLAAAESALRKAAELTDADRAKLLRSDAFDTPRELDRAAAKVREQLGAVLARQKKHPAAAAAFADAARRFADPAGANDPAAAARLGWNLSGVLADAGDPSAALAQLERFLALAPRSPEPFERLADLLRQAGRGADAVTALDRWAERQPTNPAVKWVRAAETGRSDPAAAHRTFQTLARTADESAPFRVAVRHYARVSRPADLLTLLDDLFRAARGGDQPRRRGQGPTADPAAVARARALSAAVKAERGLAGPLVRAAADGGGHAPDTWELVAWLADRDGQLDAAERVLWPLAKDGDEAAYLRLYELLCRRRKWADALTAVTAAEAAARSGRNGGVRLFDYDRAVPLAELGRPADALRAADAAVANASSKLPARLHKARVLNLLGRHAEALAECRDIQDEFPAEAGKVRYQAADALGGLKRFADAEAELRAALDADPDDVLALNNLGYTLADQGRKLAEAEELVRRAVELDADDRRRAGDPEPESGVYLDSLGWVLFRRGKLADARAALEKAVTRPDAGSDAVVWDHLGDVAFRQGDADRAKAAWARAEGLYRGTRQGLEADRLSELRRKLTRVP